MQEHSKMLNEIKCKQTLGIVTHCMLVSLQYDSDDMCVCVCTVCVSIFIKPTELSATTEGDGVLLNSLASSIPSIISTSSSSSSRFSSSSSSLRGCSEFALVLKRKRLPSTRFKVQTPPRFRGNPSGVVPSLARWDMW